MLLFITITELWVFVHLSPVCSTMFLILTDLQSQALNKTLLIFPKHKTSPRWKVALLSNLQCWTMLQKIFKNASEIWRCHAAPLQWRRCLVFPGCPVKNQNSHINHLVVTVVVNLEVGPCSELLRGPGQAWGLCRLHGINCAGAPNAGSTISDLCHCCSHS